MTLTAIIAALGGLGAIVTGIVYVAKQILYRTQVTPEQTDQQIDVQEKQNEAEEQKTGRPV